MGCGICRSKKVRKIVKVAAIATAAWIGAPYLLAAAGGITASGVTAGAGLLTAASRFRGGGGTTGPPPEQQGQPIFISGGGFGGGQGSGFSYPDIGAGGAGSQIFPGGSFDAPVIPSFSPGLILGIAGAGLVSVLLIMLIRR